MLVLFLNARYRVTGYAEVVRGTLNAARLTPRDVLVPALLADAKAIVLAHNHPSGDVTPSAADHTVTRAIRQAAELVGVALADHVIVTPHAHHSFAAGEDW